MADKSSTVRACAALPVDAWLAAGLRTGTLSVLTGSSTRSFGTRAAAARSAAVGGSNSPAPESLWPPVSWRQHECGGRK